MEPVRRPSPAIALNPKQSQKQKPVAATVQGVKLLSMTYLEMSKHLSEMALSNPFLDISDQLGSPADYGSHQDMAAIRQFSTPSHRKKRQTSFDDDDTDNLSHLQGTPFELDTLMGSLELQLSLCHLPSVEFAIGQEILGNLDERGYFSGDLDSICLYYRVQKEVGERVLKTIQGFTPRGIAARNLTECLCLQVADDEPYADVLRRIISEDLEDLVKCRTEKCAQKHQLDERTIQALFAQIRSFCPSFGAQSALRSNVCYTLPDIIVKKEGDGFCTFVRGETDTPLQLNGEYLRMLTTGMFDGSDKAYMRASLNEAKMLIKNIHVREQNMKKFAAALLRMQYAFFCSGEEHLRPMTMQNVADEIGVHVATTSRIVQNKYIDTPWGMYSLKTFFTGGCTREGQTNEKVSVHHIKRRIASLVQEENLDSPITDTQICALLQEDGYQIARRTVTKYRQAMGFMSPLKRKEYGLRR